MSGKRIAWTAEIDAFILASRPAMTFYQLAGVLGINQTSIKDRAHKLVFEQSNPPPCPIKAARNRAAGNAARRRKMALMAAGDWPCVTTTWEVAMNGKSYGGNTAVPGTKAPYRVESVRRYEGSGVGCSLA